MGGERHLLAIIQRKIMDSSNHRQTLLSRLRIKIVRYLLNNSWLEYSLMLTIQSLSGGGSLDKFQVGFFGNFLGLGLGLSLFLF